MILVAFATILVVCISPAMASVLTCDCDDICVNETGWWRDGGVWNGCGTMPIRAAVNAAAAGETICVAAGDYNENVDVNKQLTLQGAGETTVTAVDSNDHVFYVTADYVNISGFNVSGATRYGKAGIYLTGADHCNISENTASNNYYGIYMASSSDNTLLNNTMSGNDYNFGVGGLSLPHYEQNIDPSNTVDGKPIYYRVGQQDESIPLDAGYVGIVGGANITVANLTLTNNGQGVLFAYTENSRIENIISESNYHGINLYFSSNNTLLNNTADLNTYGIYLYSSSNYNKLLNNTADSNKHGIYLYSSNYNTLFDNTASNNENGIYLYPLSNYNTLFNNTASNNENGIYMRSSSDNTLLNNTASNNENGIYMRSSSDNTLLNNIASNNDHGIYLYSSSNYNTLLNNTVSDNGNWDIYVEDSSSTFTGSNLNGTTVSFTYSGDVALKGVGSPDVDPFGMHNVSKFINATSQSAGAWLYLNFSYSDSDLTANIVESSLTVWRHNGTVWTKDGWGDGQYTDAAGNVVGVNITSFSVFAPMGVLPLQCINVSPGLPQTLNINDSKYFIARGYDRDGAEISEYFAFEWDISDECIGSLIPVNDTATNFTADCVGITHLTASNGGVTSDPVQVTVNAGTDTTNVTNKKTLKAKSGGAAATGNFKNNVSGWISVTARGNATHARSSWGLGWGCKAVSGVTVNVSDDIRRALAAGNGTIRIEICYNETTLNALGINANTLAIWKYNSTTEKWMKQPSTRSGKCVYVDADHLCLYGLFGSKAVSSRGGGGSRKGTYSPEWSGTPVPAVTAKKAPAASSARTATEAPPGKRVTSDAKKKPAASRTSVPAAEGTVAEAATKDAPGFTAIFMVAGMLAVAYVMMWRRD